MASNMTGKRVVSKGAYLRAQIRRAFWWVEGLFFYLAAYTGLFIVLGFACGMLRFAPLPLLRALVTTEWVWLLLFFPILIYLCSAIARWCLTRSRTIETGVPLMLCTASYLPAPERLVRPSSEPMQAQKSVLVRAVTEKQREPDEQLVRAAGGEESSLSGVACISQGKA